MRHHGRKELHVSFLIEFKITTLGVSAHLLETKLKCKILTDINLSEVQKSFTLIFVLYFSTTPFFNINLLDIAKEGAFMLL